MMAPTSSLSKTNSGMSGWPEMMPSPSASSRRFDRIALAQVAECRRFRVGAFAGSHGRVAARAIAGDERFAALEVCVLGALRRRHRGDADRRSAGDGQSERDHSHEHLPDHLSFERAYRTARGEIMLPRCATPAFSRWAPPARRRRCGVSPLGARFGRRDGRSLLPAPHVRLLPQGERTRRPHRAMRLDGLCDSHDCTVKRAIDSAGNMLRPSSFANPIHSLRSL